MSREIANWIHKPSFLNQLENWEWEFPWETLRVFSFTMLYVGYALAMYKFKKTRVYFLQI